MRAPTEADLHPLAELMLDAYRGTIDYDGETLGQAVNEVERYLAGPAELDWSLLAIAGDEIQSAVLMSLSEGNPVVGYVMTRATAKNRGVASALLDAAVARVWASGHRELRAWITEGNGPSETMFLRAGFAVAGTIGD